ncbi:MAG: hypothetical protein ACR2LK_03485 [Solirubrobacteraceae bacterium]
MEQLASELPVLMRAAADVLISDGVVPTEELVDQLDELRALVAGSAPEAEPTTTLKEATEFLLRNIVAPDRIRDCAQDLVSVVGPSETSQLVEHLHQLGRDVLEAEDVDIGERELVEVLHGHLVSDRDEAPDYEAFDRIDERLRACGINPLMLVRHLPDLSILAEHDRLVAVEVPCPPTVGATDPDQPDVDADPAVGASDALDLGTSDIHDGATSADVVAVIVGPVDSDLPGASDDPDPEHPEGALLGSGENDAGTVVMPLTTDELRTDHVSDVDVDPVDPVDPSELPADTEAAQPGLVSAPLSTLQSPSRSSGTTSRAPANNEADGSVPAAIDADVLARLVENEPMLAALMIRATDGAEDFAAALEALALSRALGDRDGATAAELDRLLLGHEERLDESHHDGALLAAAGIGLALHAPERSTLLVLSQPPSELSYSPVLVAALHEIFAGVTQRALSREQIDAATRQADAQHELSQILDDARAMLIDLPQRESRHLPAKLVWRGLISSNGELGRRVEAISAGDAQLDDIQSLLVDWRNFDSRLNRVAAELGAKKRIIGGVRDWLSGLVRKVLDLAGRWVRTTLELQAAGEDRTDSGRQAAFVAQRRSVAAAVEMALGELETQIAASDALDAACLGALRDRLQETRAAIDGNWQKPPDLAPGVVRTVAAARAWGVELDEDGRPVGDAQRVVEELMRAVERDPADAARHQIASGNLEAAEAALLVLASTGSSTGIEGLEEQLRSARRDIAGEVEHRVREIGSRSARLLRFGIVDAARHAQITGTLELERLQQRGRYDLRRRELTVLEDELREAERSRVEELDRKLDVAVVGDEDRARIKDMLDRGDFPIAEDFLLRVERGEPLTITERPLLLEQFIDALQAPPVDLRRLIEGVMGGSDAPGFAFSVLADDERRRVRASLNAVDELVHGARQRQMKSAAAGERLRAIGEVAGLDVVAASFKPLGRSPRGLAQATIDLIPGVARWRPPLHVSPDGPRQRRTHQVVIWAGAPVAQILERLASAPGLPALIITATPMSLERRHQLEREARTRSVSFLFIDPYVLVHASILSTRDGIPPLDVLIATSMALGKANPYTAAGPVHPEMFMGRRSEAEEVRDFGRAATVYGGRQLGKSALLRDIERAVNDPGDDRRPPVIRARYIDLKREGVGDRLDPEAIWLIIGTSLAKAGIELFDGRRDRSSVVEGIELYLRDSVNELRLFLDEADDFLRRESETGFPNVYGLRQLVESHLDRFKVVFAGLHSVNRFRRIVNQPLAQLGNPVRIGPLKWEEARELVVTPLEALGYRFADEALVDLVLVETRRHPNLIQFACKRLVDHVASRAEARGGSSPLRITRDDLAEIFENDEEFRDWLRERFELTLNLYRHYKVLALILAMEAHADESVRIAGLQLHELEGLARSWWPEGFANMTPDEFTVVVEEMENLEVLALNKETRRYRLPSVNLLRLLGGSDEIERHLIAELERPPEAEDEGAQHDRRAVDHGHSSLTYDDERRLFGAGQHRITLVLGNRALGSDQVSEDIADAATKPEWDRSVVQRTINVLDALPALEPRAVLIASMRPTPRQMQEVVQALRGIAQMDHADDQRIVLTFGDEWMPRWLDLLDHVDMLASEHTQTIVLKRWNRGAFRRLLEPFGANAERAGQWLITTGGYPIAVSALDGDVIADCDPEDKSRYARLIADGCGLDRTPYAARVLEELAQGGTASASDLQELIGEGSLVEVDAATRLLTMLGLTTSSRDGYALNALVPAAEIARLR